MSLSLSEYWCLVQKTPLSELPRKVWNVLLRIIRSYGEYLRDCFFPSLFAPGDFEHTATLARLLPDLDAGDFYVWHKHIVFLAEQTLAHRFDLLGSGWQKVAPHVTYPGFGNHHYAMHFDGNLRLNYANQRAAALWRSKLLPDYLPIDWQRDYRSGYRWDESCHYDRVVYGALPGVDVKLPWELARMHHLAWLALAFGNEKKSDKSNTDIYLAEFQNQVIDFLSANPPRFGVNWVCTMDVGIRIANVLWAADMFQAFGAKFSDVLQEALFLMASSHAEFIVDHLEWFPEWRSNHYLANIAGLAIAAAYLPESPQSNAQLQFAVTELAHEIDRQFLPDGGNFEGSTSYHRLSSEMLAFSVAVILAVPEGRQHRVMASTRDVLRHRGPGPLPPKHLFNPNVFLFDYWRDYFVKIAYFTRAITRPDGRCGQFGDNDSGRFLKILPALSLDDGGEISGNHQALVEAMLALHSVLNTTLATPEGFLISCLAEKSNGRTSKKIACNLELNDFMPFNDFGLYIYRRPNLWFAIRCGSVGQCGRGGHAHNDQLSFELALNGITFIVDPGTCCYTPDVFLRNKFRSTYMHNTLVADPGQQNDWLEGRIGLFSMIRIGRCHVETATRDFFKGSHSGFAAQHQREIHIMDQAIHCMDLCEAPNRSVSFHLAPKCQVSSRGDREVSLLCDGVTAAFQFDGGHALVEKGFFSEAYGRMSETHVIRLVDIPSRINWSLSCDIRP